jgi:hypothetical protein
MNRHWGIARRAVGLAVLITSIAGGTAQAASTSSTSPCSDPNYTLTQPFSAAPSNDANWYMLAPGQTTDAFNGAGWTLTGGAKIVTTTLADGATSTVLDLPAGAKAVSPQICVDSAYPTARLRLRDVSGPPSVSMFVAYAGGSPSPTNGLAGGTSWGVTPPIQLHPGNLSGWQEAQYTFEGGAKGTEAQLYDFYIDPRCRL